MIKVVVIATPEQGCVTGWSCHHRPHGMRSLPSAASHKYLLSAQCMQSAGSRGEQGATVPVCPALPGSGLRREAPRGPLSRAGVACGQASCGEDLAVGWAESEEGEWGESGRCEIGVCKGPAASKTRAHLRTSCFRENKDKSEGGWVSASQRTGSKGDGLPRTEAWRSTWAKSPSPKEKEFGLNLRAAGSYRRL